MEKEGKTKEIKFNPADYNYMDSLSVEGYVWEFIRRSKEYKDAYKKWMKQIKIPYHQLTETQKDFIGEYMDKFSPFVPKNPKKKWTEGPSYSFNDPKRKKLNPVLTVNLGIGIGVDAKHGEPISAEHPSIFKKETNDTTIYTIKGYSDGRYPAIKELAPFKLKDGTRPTITTVPLINHPINYLWEYQGQKNIVMALIDISAPGSIDDLLNKLKEELLFWRKELKLPKTRSPKTDKYKKNVLIKNSKIWKSYLMVFDLVDAGKSINEVSTILSEYDDFYSDVENVNNHYRKALTLITGDYKKYI